MSILCPGFIYQVDQWAWPSKIPPIIKIVAYLITPLAAQSSWSYYYFYHKDERAKSGKKQRCFKTRGERREIFCHIQAWRLARRLTLEEAKAAAAIDPEESGVKF